MIKQRIYERVIALVKTKVARISSDFPASLDDIWIRLQKIETLQYIAAPYAYFKLIDTGELIWREGVTMRFRAKIFGFLPLGVHTIHILAFDKEQGLVRSAEHNRMVPIWKHTIQIVPTDDKSAHYMDEVEIGAGALTGIVYLWSKLFYAHRQKKWLHLLSR